MEHVKEKIDDLRNENIRKEEIIKEWMDKLKYHKENVTRYEKLIKRNKGMIEVNKKIIESLKKEVDG